MASILAFVLAAAVIILAMSMKKRRYRLPPGPRGLPIVGNLWDIPESSQWITYRTWGRDYGSDIIHLRLLGSDVLVLNSLKAVRDLLEKRSKLYSDRERRPMLHDLIGWDGNIAFMPYGDSWREHRRLFHQQFHPGVTHKYHHIISEQVRKLLKRLIAQPEDFMQHVRTMAGAVILAITYGIDVQSDDDEYVKLAESAIESLAVTGNAGSYVVDYLPILQYLPSWVPGAQFKRDAERWKGLVAAMFERPLQFVKRNLGEGNVQPSIAASLLSSATDEDSARRENVIRDVAGTAYVGGADTTVSALGTFILAMVMYPDVQKTAQEEIDRVVGHERLPTYEDLDNLPYVGAVLKESLRWHLVTPLAIPHRLTCDDEYEGYDFPANSVVVGNAWAILHDEERYPNPETFDPTRFLTPEGKLDEQAPDPSEDGAFGFGRRICPGRQLAIDSIWLTIACVLATTAIEKVKDEAGRVLEPSGDCTSGLLSYPAPFNAGFRPRSLPALALIQVSEPLHPTTLPDT